MSVAEQMRAARQRNEEARAGRVVQLKAVTPPAPKSPMPEDMPKLLRKIADEVERGTVTSMVLGFTINGQYQFVFPSSLTDSLVLANLLHTRCAQRFEG